jgi:hypothetical protein
MVIAKTIVNFYGKPVLKLAHALDAQIFDDIIGLYRGIEGK